MIETQGSAQGRRGQRGSRKPLSEKTEVTSTPPGSRRQAHSGHPTAPRGQDKRPRVGRRQAGLEMGGRRTAGEDFVYCFAGGNVSLFAGEEAQEEGDNDAGRSHRRGWERRDREGALQTGQDRRR